MDVRTAQKKDKDASALSDRQFNLLNDKTAFWYQKFLDTFQGTKHPEEVRVAIFRARMRLAALMTKKYFSSPQEEYEAIGSAVGAYGLSLIHISEPTRLLSISYAVFCLKKKKI
eukprot:TRINITY_DN25941_c0_g1_i1.p3 TRINITY_DN25941_c0_g1~~TRINITY_DN25941_c0_g1_i1.p3  ORF type:complete len:114 (+),score=42.65 TRINITY_DN25941_c0_g1_i1:290-631(+)